MQQGRFSPNETYQTDDITRKITINWCFFR